MLSYAEQLLLLTVDPVSGRLFPIPAQVFHLTLAGAFLFDASFKGLINDDPEQLEVLCTTDTKNPPLDEALRCLLICEHSIPIKKAISIVAAHGPTLSQMAWESLEKKGILTSRKKTLLDSNSNQKLFSPDLPRVVGIHRKIRKAIFNQKIPDVNVPPLISLIVSGGLTKYILNPEESKQFKERIAWLAGMESLGREIIRSVQELELTDLEKEVASLIGMNHTQPKTFAGGMDAILSSLNFLYKEAGLSRSHKLIRKFNQSGGFECPGCAWPNPDKKCSRFEFCENGSKNVSAAATTKLINPDFFRKWSVKDLLLTSEYWLEQQGRLTTPMMLDENSSHYRPISWDDAFQTIAGELRALGNPNEAIFYSSGRTSNEAAFLYQLLARAFGTNNLPNSANLCHEPSGVALKMSLGYGKSSVTLDDFPKAEAIFIFGHNPGSNHPRMLSALQLAVRNGCKIVAVNPMLEASMIGFADPQETGSYFGSQTYLSYLNLQPMINGDMALIRGIVKSILETEYSEGGILDSGFIQKYTNGFESYLQTVINTPWDSLITASGVEKIQIVEAAQVYINAKTVIATWCLGITHHRNSIETIREITNLMLLRGNIGRPGSGLIAVRGHSNVQGTRTVGAGENMPVSFLESLEERFSIKVPRNPGMSAIPAIKSIASGHAKILVSLGGNLASALPDSLFVKRAIKKCRLTVMISTKLNMSHLITGKKALILPCFSRLEEDIQKSIKQLVSVEDTMGKIGFSRGCLPTPSPNVKSEIWIISGMAKATLKEINGIEWRDFEDDYHYVRKTISEVIPVLKDLGKNAVPEHSFYLENPLKNRIFNTNIGKAQFSNYPIEMDFPNKGELFLMTIRSHDQFNTSIFGLNDRYRGIRNERRVLFMNSDDMVQRDISPEQLVDIASNNDGKIREMKGYYAIPYPIRQGCAAAYFPEANELTSISNTNNLCQTPAYKSISIQVRKSSARIQ